MGRYLPLNDYWLLPTYVALLVGTYLSNNIVRYLFGPIKLLFNLSYNFNFNSLRLLVETSVSVYEPFSEGPVRHRYGPVRHYGGPVHFLGTGPFANIFEI